MFSTFLHPKVDEQYKNKQAIIFDSALNNIREMTYAQLEMSVLEIAQILKKHGIKREDNILLISDNHIYWLPTFLGIISAEAIAVPLDGGVAKERYESIFNDCSPAAVIISRKYEHRLNDFGLSGMDMCSTIDLHCDIFVFNSQTEGVVEEEKTFTAPSPEDIAAIIYTSGTTGDPRGIMLSHRAFLEAIKIATNASGYKAEDSMLALLPYTHVFALVDSGLFQLYNYSTVVICNSFNPVDIMGVLVKHRVNHIIAVPRLAELFAMGLSQQPRLKLEGLTLIIGGAAPSKEVIRTLHKSGITVYQGFGMTETAAGILLGKDSPIESVGKPDHGVEIIIDKDEDEEAGELLIKTPSIFSGVFGRPDLYSEMFVNGYFKTGDIASIDSDGFVYIKGRAKEIIITSSGLNIYPDELEARLRMLPYADEYAIFAYREDGREYPAIAMLCRNEFFKDRNIGQVEEFIEDDIRKKTIDWPEAEKIRKIFISSSPLSRAANGKIRRVILTETYSADNNEIVANDNQEITLTDKSFFDLFKREVADFLNTDHQKISETTRISDFVQMGSLGIIALLMSLESRFEISFRELIGKRIETFFEIFQYLSGKVNYENLPASFLKKGKKITSMPTLLDYSPQAVEQRQEFIRTHTGYELFELPKPVNPSDLTGNIEGLVGYAQIPIGACGPININGEYAKGEYYVPIATTEGALVSSLTRGCRIINMAGGAETKIIADSVVRTPIFVFENLDKMCKFMNWIEQSFTLIKQEAETTTSHGKLLKIEPYPMNNKVVLRFVYSTGDASGQNMTTIATRKAIEFIISQCPIEIKEWFLESNLSGDKKINAVNFISNRGKKVFASCVIPSTIIKKALRTTPEAMERMGYLSTITSLQSMSYGAQAHYANTLAAVYIAAGQDPACVGESAAGFTQIETNEDKMHISVTLPGIMVGSVGGGTRLRTQHDCLKMMDCSGAGKAKKLAEIIAATVLAGEISIIGAMTADEFTKAHARYGRTSGSKHK